MALTNDGVLLKGTPDQKRCTCAFSDGRDKWPILLFWLQFLLSSLYILLSDLLLLQSAFLQVELTKLQMWLWVQNRFSFYSHLCLVSTVYHSSCKIRFESLASKKKTMLFFGLTQTMRHFPLLSGFFWLGAFEKYAKHFGKQRAPSLDKDQQSVLLMAIQCYTDTHTHTDAKYCMYKSLTVLCILSQFYEDKMCSETHKPRHSHIYSSRHTVTKTWSHTHIHRHCSIVHFLHFTLKKLETWNTGFPVAENFSHAEKQIVGAIFSTSIN